jgi:hypothetical protein
VVTARLPLNGSTEGVGPDGTGAGG